MDQTDTSSANAEPNIEKETSRNYWVRYSVIHLFSLLAIAFSIAIMSGNFGGPRVQFYPLVFLLILILSEISLFSRSARKVTSMILFIIMLVAVIVSIIGFIGLYIRYDMNSQIWILGPFCPFIVITTILVFNSTRRFLKNVDILAAKYYLLSALLIIALSISVMMLLFFD